MQPFVVDGMLDKNELTVSASVGEFSGNFRLTQAGARGRWRYLLAERIGNVVNRLLGVRRDDC